MTRVRWADGGFSALFTAHDCRRRPLRAADDDSDGELWRFPVSWAWLAHRRLVVWRPECENAAPAITPCHRGMAWCRDSAETWRGRGSRGGAAVHGQESDEAHS